ncbi:MAG: acyl-CoA dehydrogenase [Acidimicrobiia bacterium]|nr:acyl-CoA dehydrogenase [Acidimicrobiia bacterium]
MSIAIHEIHAELEAVARSFLEAHAARQAARAQLDASDETLPAFWEPLAELGWLGLHIPEEYGGSGGAIPELVVVLEELGRAVAPGPFLPTVMASAVIAERGSPAQAERFLPGLADGTVTAALGLEGNLQRKGSVVEGDAGVVLGAGLADLIVLAVGTDLVIVDTRGGTGSCVSLETATNLDPTRRSARVGIAGLDVDDSALLRDARPLGLALARILASAEAVGGAYLCTEEATEYAKVREQFGRVIGMFQAVKHICADMLVEAEAATAAVWDAARAAAGGDATQIELAAAVAAVQALPAFLRNAQRNIQVHGGIGFTWEHDAHMYLRRAVTLQLLLPPDDAALDVARFAKDGVKRDHAFELPAEAEEYREEARRAAEELKSLPDNGTRRARMIDTGYVQPHWPKPWGREAKALEQLVIDEEFRRVKVRMPDLGITGWVILTIAQHGTGDQVERWVRPTLEGRLTWCQLFSEPGAGSDAAGITTKAVRVDGGWEITGQKVWTSGAQISDFGLATVRTDFSKPKHAGITTVVVDMKAEGVDVRPLRECTGHSLFNEVFFDSVFVSDDDVVGDVDAGWTVARATLGNERLSIGGGSAAPIPINVVELTRTTDCTDPLLLRDVGLYVAETATIKAVNLRRVERAVADTGPGPEGNVTKFLTALNSQTAGDLAQRLLGTGAVVLDQGVAEMATFGMLFSRAMTIAGGTTEITRNQIGERILGLPRDPLVK